MLELAFKKQIKFASERLILRVLFPEDVSDDYVNGLNDKDINKFLVARFTKHTKNSTKEFVSQQLEDKNVLFFGIFLRESDALIGTIRVVLQPYHFIAGLGILIFNKKMYGKGYATEALNRVVSFVFDDLGYHCVEARAYCDNTASVKLFLKVGFNIQSRISNKYRYGNSFIDVFVFNIFNSNFNKISMFKLK